MPEGQIVRWFPASRLDTRDRDSVDHLTSAPPAPLHRHSLASKSPRPRRNHHGPSDRPSGDRRRAGRPRPPRRWAVELGWGSRPLESTSQITWLPEVTSLFCQGSRFWGFFFPVFIFFLRAVLGSQPNQGEGTEISCVPVSVPCTPAQAAHSSQLTDTPPQSPKARRLPEAGGGVPSGGVRSVDKYVMAVCPPLQYYTEHFSLP